MRTTLTLDDDIAEAARALARTTGQTLGQVISELVRRSIHTSPARSRKSRIPTFAVKNPREIIPADRARKVMEEEGP